MITSTLTLILVISTSWANEAIQGQPFESARAVGQDVLIPMCPAHFCNGTASKDQICSCNSNCYKTRDCCLDALPDSRVSHLLDNDLWSCVTTPRGLGPYSLIGRCPANWTNAVVRTGCEGSADLSKDPNQGLIVTSTFTNVTYKNIYCGQCNEGEIKQGHFHLRFKCSGKNVSNVPEALKDPTCDTYVNDSTATFCEQMDRTITTCPQSWTHKNATYAKEMEWRCDTYFAPITIADRRYKNVFCALCHNSSFDIEKVVCRNSYYPIEQEFILQLDGEFGAGTLIPGGGGKLCQLGEVYDPFRKSCRRVMCQKAMDCNVTWQSWTDVPLVRSASPCNMTLLNSTLVEINPDGSITIEGSPVKYRKGEYEIVKVKKDEPAENSYLLCRRSNSNGISLFPQHFCQRRQLLGYGSCGCEADCVQSRSCCLDAFDDSTVDVFRTAEAWTCLNDSRGSSAIAKCPSNFTDAEVRKQCEQVPSIEADPLVHVPVFAWAHSSLYRNVFCAVCNGATNVTFHNLHFLCAEHSKLRNGWEAAEHFISSPGLCSLQMDIKDPELPVKQCVQDKNCRECPDDYGVNGDEKEAAIRWRCDHFYAPVVINGTCYRNDFCSMCNGNVLTDSKNQRVYSDSLIADRMKPNAEKKSQYTTFTVG